MAKVFNSGRADLSYCPPTTPTLDECSWAEISEISASGKAAKYWSIGDCKKIHVEGLVGTLDLNEDYYVYIIGFDHNEALEGKGVTFGCFKTMDMVDVCLVVREGSYTTDGSKLFNLQHWGDNNSGGWRGCDARYDILGSTDIPPDGYGEMAEAGRIGYDASDTCAINPVENTLMAAFPADLRAVMRPMSVYTDGVAGGTNDEGSVVPTLDYLPLLSEFELMGERSGANSYEQNYQERYSYYASGMDLTKYQHDNVDVAANYWMRSPTAGSSTSWRRISSATGIGANNDCYLSRGIAPIFRV